MSAKQYYIALTVTYVPYIVAELPSNLVLKVTSSFSPLVVAQSAAEIRTQPDASCDAYGLGRHYDLPGKRYELRRSSRMPLLLGSPRGWLIPRTGPLSVVLLPAYDAAEEVRFHLFSV